jgi:hypothetical protein
MSATEKRGVKDIPPRVGQVWADNDSRSAGRTLRITDVGLTHVSAVVLTHKDGVLAVGSPTRTIAIRRMIPNSSGYYLLRESDRPAEPGQPR